MKIEAFWPTAGTYGDYYRALLRGLMYRPPLVQSRHTRILSSWKKWEKGKNRGGKNNSNFYLLESRIIFTGNVVGYYNLENYGCNLPVDNAPKAKHRLLVSMLLFSSIKKKPKQL